MTADGRAGVDLPQVFADEMGALLGPDFPKSLVLAVSGGGDSMAMLYLAAPWARVMGIALQVVTINHNLRPEAADEVALVQTACSELGVPHRAQDWHWDGKGNLQDAARQARLAILAESRGDGEHVLMAHTQDDQAETFVLRLARGSGVDGLAAMAKARVDSVHGLVILRPLLDVSRAALRHYLQTLQIAFADDPSNEDVKYARVQVRQAWPVLEGLGLTRETLSATAARMADARETLIGAAQAAHDACIAGIDDPGAGVFDVVYQREVFVQLDRHTQLRLLAAALQFVSGQPYRPRFSGLETALDRALAGGATTLHGGYIYPQGDRLYVCVEYNSVKDARVVNGLWRGEIPAPEADIRALGEGGAAQLRSRSDLPARVLWPTPAVWDGPQVIAAPRLGPNPVWSPQSRASLMREVLNAH